MDQNLDDLRAGVPEYRIGSKFVRRSDDKVFTVKSRGGVVEATSGSSNVIGGGYIYECESEDGEALTLSSYEVHMGYDVEIP